MGDGEVHKHLQLGLTEDDLGDEDPIPLPDDADLDALWDTATTVEQYKADIEELAAVKEVVELAPDPPTEPEKSE